MAVQRATTVADASSGGASQISELVAGAVDRQHVFGTVRVGFELAPDVLDVCVNGSIERLDIFTADGIEQLRAGEDAAGAARQGRDQLELGRRDVDRLAAASNRQPIVLMRDHLFRR